MTMLAGVIRSRLPTLAVMIMTALFFALATLVALPRPELATDRYSVRARHDAEAALREANESVKAAAGMPTPDQVAAQQTPVVPGTDVTPVAQAALNQTPLTQAEQQHEDNIRLIAAPDMAVAERVSDGILPAIADDGRRAWQVYARPFADQSRPHVVVVVAGLGADGTIANAAIERLPGTVTLAFDAQWANRDDMLSRARKAGHETLLAIPAEPFDYPNSDPGPDTLLTNLQPKENIRRLQSFLKQGTGYVGVMTLTGTRFVSVPKAAQVLLDEVEARGLALMDGRIAERASLAEQAARLRLPVAAADFRINSDMALTAIDQVFAQAAFTAKKTGQAICLVIATPLAIDRLNHWLLELPNSGIVVAPFSAALR